jgi:HTH-type transcriptional regulator/antitoxin HigA
MAGRKIRSRFEDAPDTYLELVRRCPLRPIRSDADLDRAQEMLDALLKRDHLGAAEEDYLDVLSDLVERYEDRVHPIETGDLSEGEMLAHLIEARGVTQAAVARGAGIAESTLSEVLRGKRHLTRAQIGKLAGYFHVGPGLFLQADRE